MVESHKSQEALVVSDHEFMLQLKQCPEFKDQLDQLLKLTSNPGRENSVKKAAVEEKNEEGGW